MKMKLKLCVWSIALAICSANQPNQSESMFKILYNNQSIQIQLEMPLLNDTIFNSTLNPLVDNVMDLRDFNDLLFNQSRFESTTRTVESTSVTIRTNEVPNNTFVFNGRKYIFHTESREGWFDAGKYCRNNRMRLVEIYSAEENNWIANKIKEIGFGNHSFWTGGRYSVPTLNFKWNYAKEIKFENWAECEPVKKSGYLCVDTYFILLTAATDFKWNSVNRYHDNKNYFLCKDIVNENSDFLPHNTFMFAGRKYHFGTKSRMSVDDASLYCYGQDRHMDLASIVSKEENDWIVSKIKEIGFRGFNFWTGGVFKNIGNGELRWKTFLDDELDKVTFTNWAEGQPRTFYWEKEEFCVALTASKKFKWSIISCHRATQEYVVCKEKYPNNL